MDRRNDRALVIAKDIVERRRFNVRYNNWEQSEIRRFLNGEFYNSFSATDRARIIETPIATANATTLDRIFLLSLDEVTQYFNRSADRVATWNGVHSLWWLRSPCDNCNYVYAVPACEGFSGSGVNRIYGVRPALWLRL